MVGGLNVRDVFQILSVWSNFLTMVFNVTFSNMAGILFYFLVHHALVKTNVIRSAFACGFGVAFRTEATGKNPVVPMPVYL